MFEEGLIPTTVKIKNSQYIMLKKLGINLSEEVRKHLDVIFANPKMFDDQIKAIQEEKKIALQQQVLVSNPKLPEDEMNFFIESNKILSKNPSFLNGRIGLYKNTFAKSITPEKFKGLMKKAVKKKENKIVIKERKPKAKEEFAVE